jgi:hypothetical protein
MVCVMPPMLVSPNKTLNSPLVTANGTSVPGSPLAAPSLAQ